uniref:Uncharacterized protein n=1 Tax=Glossina austeni TaxID=7395 RepID=A0A1A9VYF3_GLOAU
MYRLYPELCITLKSIQNYAEHLKDIRRQFSDMVCSPMCVKLEVIGNVTRLVSPISDHCWPNYVVIGEKENEEKLCNFLSNQWHVRPNQIDINEQRCTSNEKCSNNILKRKSALKTNQTQHQHQHQHQQQQQCRSYLVER